MYVWIIQIEIELTFHLNGFSAVTVDTMCVCVYVEIFIIIVISRMEFTFDVMLLLSLQQVTMTIWWKRETS